ncbi:hypothetical protein BLA23254_07829 [Burkholderia lata]|uniref:Uncharacterized protein n=1 Tax=Burkholderia lata (strain ATCC 17760 / DSM 23089 / LMG 22485 / NCIMB 9086 / R18194 / 383) TaxID=482957 RepID=A0A6P2SZZ3_BURL3|nr:hypothetical protein [Burkholderia lata]VWC50980.1 hypothetical protein BLA23254_07829 [Burkholderia lata]
MSGNRINLSTLASHVPSESAAGVSSGPSGEGSSAARGQHLPPSVPSPLSRLPRRQASKVQDEEEESLDRRAAKKPRASSFTDDVDMPDVGLSNTQPASNDISLRTEMGLAFHHVTPMRTVVSDLHTGELLMEMHGSQIPVAKVNHGFPIKDSQKPYAVHSDYVSPADPFRCHPNVKVGNIELPPETKSIMQHYFPVEAAKPDYFAKRENEIKAEYEAPLHNKKPPSALQWRPKRLTPKECYSKEQAQALAKTFGVVAIDYDNQNFGGMGPPFAGAELKTAAQRRQYIAQTSKAAFDDFSMRAGDPRNHRELVRFAPYGGGNLAQFMNGKASPEEQAHFIAVDVIVNTTNKYGEPRRVVAPHLFQIALVPKGMQAILDYGDGGYFYGGKRPGMSLQNPSEIQQEIKTEPVDDEMNIDAPGLDAITPSTTASSAKRPAPSNNPREPKRHQSSLSFGASGRAASMMNPPRQSPRRSLRSALEPDASPFIHSESSATASRLQALTIDQPEDDDSSSLSSVPATDVEDYDFENLEEEESATVKGKRVSSPSDIDKKSDDLIISKFPPGIWEKAQVLAKQSTLPTGVTFQEATDKKPKPVYQAHLSRKRVGYFSVVQGRDNSKSRAMAIATRLAAEALEGGGQRKDTDVIAKFPPNIWEQAQLKALERGLPTGVRFTSNRYLAGMRMDGKEKTLGSFSVLPGRDNATAKALAIATIMMAKSENNLEKKDQSIIEKFPGGVWEAAQQRADQPGLPRGVTLREASARGPSRCYSVHFKNKFHGYFSVLEDRDERKAKSMAIATRMILEMETGVGDAQAIAKFPPGMWDRAKTRAEEPGLPNGVNFIEPSGGKSPTYVARISLSGKKVTLGHFAVMANRGDATARALAIATRWTAELEKEE